MDGSWDPHKLCRSAEESPAAGISTAVLVQLMQAALHHRDFSLLHALSCCRAAAQISTSVMVSLVIAAVKDLPVKGGKLGAHLRKCGATAAGAQPMEVA